MTTIRILGTDIDARCHNKREVSLVSIVNTDIKRYADYLRDKDSEMGKSLKQETFDHWMIVELSGMFSAMYFLKIVEHSISELKAWDIVWKLSRK